MLKVPANLSEGMTRMKQGAAGVADCVPVYAQISNHSARLAGVPSRAFFTEAETFLRCELAADELYGIDGPTIHYDFYNIEAEALGAELTWLPDEIPAFDQRRPLLKSVDDWRSLRPVRMGRDGRMPYVLEINRRLADLGLGPKVRFTGLFTLAANLLGLENLILAIRTQPDAVHRLMRFLTDEVVAPWIVCQREEGGKPETASGADALASPPLLSLPLVREFCLQYIQELERQLGKIRLAGLWGESSIANPDELLQIKREGSVESIQALDPDVSVLGPAYFRQWADRAGVPLVMGVDAYLIRMGPIPAIEARVERFIDEAGLPGRFVLFLNDVPYDTPPEHVHAAIAVARQYRRNDAGDGYVRRPTLD